MVAAQRSPSQRAGQHRAIAAACQASPCASLGPYSPRAPGRAAPPQPRGSGSAYTPLERATAAFLEGSVTTRTGGCAASCRALGTRLGREGERTPPSRAEPSRTVQPCSTCGRPFSRRASWVGGGSIARRG